MSVPVVSLPMDVGESIPPLTPHAVSVSLPTWSANVGYEEGEEWVVSKMKTGYPRFFINVAISELAAGIVKQFGHPGERAMLFPTHKIAERCLDFMASQESDFSCKMARILDLIQTKKHCNRGEETEIPPFVSAVIFPEPFFGIAKLFWQHTGDGISSRRAEFYLKLLEAGDLRTSTTKEAPQSSRGPRRYQRKHSLDETSKSDLGRQKDDTSKNGTDPQDSTQFVEERFGRNLDSSSVLNAKLAITRRIAGSLNVSPNADNVLDEDVDGNVFSGIRSLKTDDVYLYPTGMSSIFNTHRSLLIGFGEFKSISFGFPYIDTLKILEKFGPGCLFYGFGSCEELDDLEKRLQRGERYLALFCEFPGNPLLKCPNLCRIRTLADKYGFLIVVDETLGNFRNINVLPYADIVVSSLTKIFSGDCNVMGGSAILNPKGPHYSSLKKTWDKEYEATVWPEDMVFLERNSRDFVSRIDRINRNAEAICDVLMASPKVKQVNYPKYSSTKPFYEQCRTPNGGYGGLLSATFHKKRDAIVFYDHLDTAKGPSLGTNFTLSSPYVILAHYGELDWAASFGVEADLVRFSVGLEETSDIAEKFLRALRALGD